MSDARQVYDYVACEAYDLAALLGGVSVSLFQAEAIQSEWVQLLGSKMAGRCALSRCMKMKREDSNFC